LDHLETDYGEIIDDKRLKIFKLGDLTLWTEDELTDEIFKIIFSAHSKKITSKIKALNDQESPKKLVKDYIAKKDTNNTQKQANVNKIKVINRKFLPYKIFKALLITSIIILIFISSLSYWYYISAKTIYQNFKKHIAVSNFTEISKDFDKAKFLLNTLDKTYAISYTLLVPFRNTAFMNTIHNNLSTARNLILISQETINFVSKLSISKSPSVSDNTIEITDFKLIKDRIDRLQQILVTSRADIEKQNLIFIPPEDLINFIDDSLIKLQTVNDLLPVYEKYFYTLEPKTYLLLLQNNMELRPTGGFIGSFALLTVQKGKIQNLTISDVYTADGQLKGHVDPPEPIRKYLNQPNWFLRDSNFDPDFAQSAQQAIWFLDKEINLKVDGVIAVNLFVLTDILRVTGPIKLADFNNEIIHADNFFIKASEYSQENFFPGSNQKKDFLLSVSRNIQYTIFDNPNINMLPLLDLLKRSFENKNVMLYSIDKDTQKFLDENNLSGRISQIGCIHPKNAQNSDSSFCYFDYLSINEANFGINKANYFVNKSILINKYISDKGLLNTLIKISYENIANSELKLGGDYKSYLRLILPVGTRINEVKIGDNVLADDSLEKEDYGFDKVMFGLLIMVSEGKKLDVYFNYQLPFPIERSFGQYQFYYQKQSGDKISPLVFNLNYAENYNFSPLNFTPTSQRQNELYFSTDTSVDRVFVLNMLSD
jgi:hypothetical protein